MAKKVNKDVAEAIASRLRREPQSAQDVPQTPAAAKELPPLMQRYAENITNRTKASATPAQATANTSPSKPENITRVIKDAQNAASIPFPEDVLAYAFHERQAFGDGEEQAKAGCKVPLRAAKPLPPGAKTSDGDTYHFLRFIEDRYSELPEGHRQYYGHIRAMHHADWFDEHGKLIRDARKLPTQQR